MPYYHVPVTLVIQSDSAGYALDTAEAELRSLVQRWSQEITTYIVPESAASVWGAEEDDDLDAPHILPEDFPLPPTRQLTDTERAVLRGMLP